MPRPRSASWPTPDQRRTVTGLHGDLTDGHRRGVGVDRADPRQLYRCYIERCRSPSAHRASPDGPGTRMPGLERRPHASEPSAGRVAVPRSSSPSPVSSSSPAWCCPLRPAHAARPAAVSTSGPGTTAPGSGANVAVTDLGDSRCVLGSRVDLARQSTGHRRLVRGLVPVRRHGERRQRPVERLGGTGARPDRIQRRLHRHRPDPAAFTLNGTGLHRAASDAQLVVAPTAVTVPEGGPRPIPYASAPPRPRL